MEFSEEYYKMIERHAEAHTEGVMRDYRDGRVHELEGDKVFEGSEIKHVLKPILELKQAFDCQSVLDYGCGKAYAYSKAFEVDNELYYNFCHYTDISPAAVCLYDPAYPEFKQPPRDEQVFDMSICTDVLEHIPEEDTPKVLDMILKHTGKVAIFTISSHPSFTKFKDGTNAHVNLNDDEWWSNQLREAVMRCKRNVLIHAEISSGEDGSEKVTVNRFQL